MEVASALKPGPGWFGALASQIEYTGRRRYIVVPF